MIRNTKERLDELEALADALGVEVRYEQMAGLVRGCGGLCRIDGRHRLIVDRKLKPAERVQILVDTLRRFDLRAHELSPAVSALLS